MANGEKVKKEDLPEPTFIEQANALIDKKFDETKFIEDPRFGPGLRPFDHKVLVGVMDLQVKHVYDVLVKEFTATVAGHYDPIMAYLKKLDANYDNIKYELTRLNLHQQKSDERISIEEEEILNTNKRLEEERGRITELQKHMDFIDHIIKPEVIEDFLTKVNIVTPKLDRIIETQKTSRIAKRIALSVLIAVAIMSTILSIVMYNHKRATITNKIIPQTEVPKDSTIVNP